MIGARFHWLVVVGTFTAKGNRWCECRCDCGNLKSIRLSSLQAGFTKSCGCYASKRMTRMNTKHGMSETPEWRTWRAMRQRCEDRNSKSYPDYGGRGIAVCDRWQSFEAFLEDMGSRPSASHQIERIDNNLGYEPGNCRWATRSEQARNRRSSRLITCNGRTQTLVEWSTETGIRRDCIAARIARGWSMEAALGFPGVPA